MPLNDHTLGRSLGKVFASTSRKESATPKGAMEVDLGMLIPPAANPRRQFNDEALQELADSIAKHGILQPIIVLRQKGGFEILAGERRYRAAQLAGLQRVPVVVRDRSDESQLAQLRLIENIQREDLNAIDLAMAYRSLIDEHGLTQEQVASQVGKDRSSIANSLRLLTLPEELRALVADGDLSMGHARALITIQDPAIARRLARRVIDEGLSVRALERLVREAGEAAPASSGTPAARSGKPPHIRELEGNLGRLFDAEVSIKERGGRGQLTVRFHSKGHFQDVIDILDRACQDQRRTDADPADS